MSNKWEYIQENNAVIRNNTKRALPKPKSEFE